MRVARISVAISNVQSVTMSAAGEPWHTTHLENPFPGVENRKSGRDCKTLDSAIRIKTLPDNAAKFNPFNLLVLFVDLIISDAFH